MCADTWRWQSNNPRGYADETSDILVVLAAGIGSRYGGLKQIDPDGAQRRDHPGLLGLRRAARRIQQGRFRASRRPSRMRFVSASAAPSSSRSTLPTSSSGWTTCRRASRSLRAGRSRGARRTPRLPAGTRWTVRSWSSTRTTTTAAPPTRPWPIISRTASSGWRTPITAWWAIAWATP